jgi:hypothetical protein
MHFQGKYPKRKRIAFSKKDLRWARVVRNPPHLGHPTVEKEESRRELFFTLSSERTAG